MDAKDVILGGLLLSSKKSGGGGSVVVPDISATAESLSAGSDATVTKSGTNTNVVFNFGIPRGADGAQGPAGQRGEKGDPGAQGPAGPQGETGPQGQTGPQGAVGATGPQGAPGATGQIGPQGPQGIQGEKGDPGSPFLISKVYATKGEMDSGYATDGLAQGQLAAIATDTGGDQGGYIYVKGPTAYDFFYDISTTEGIQGPQGPAGPQGPQGEQGPAGAAGATGPQGEQGEPGPAGPQGETGPAGPAGSQGPAGADGVDGQAATITVGTVTTGAPGSNASVTNSGTEQAAVLDFVIPQGAKGDPGSGGGGTDLTAGDGINIANDQISVRVSLEPDNATQIYQGAIYTPTVAPVTIWPQISARTIPATPNITVTATKGDAKLTAQTNEQGIASIEIPNFGTWDLSAEIENESVALQIVVSTARQYNATLATSIVCGVSWDTENPSTQLTRLSIANDPNNYVTVDISTEPSPAIGTGEGSSPFDQYAPWSEMYVCNLNSAGQETAKKGGAGFSYSTDDVMVWIPEFYYKIIEQESIRYFYISNKQLEGFEKHPGSGKYIGRYETGTGWKSTTSVLPIDELSRASVRTNSRAKGSGWDGFDYMTWCAVWLLYLVEFADWDSQAVIGQGIVNVSENQRTGGTDSMIYHTGRAAGTDDQSAVQYRGIENLWGNVYQWIDGINIQSGIVYICTDPQNYADGTTQNYESTRLPGSTVSGYITQLGWLPDFPWAFIPTSADGSETTFIPDRGVISSNSSWYGVMVGNHRNNKTRDGLFDFYSSQTSTTTYYYYNGARLLFRP